jgi:hypothetical protein
VKAGTNNARGGGCNTIISKRKLDQKITGLKKTEMRIGRVLRPELKLRTKRLRFGD